jgi:hypothetical protein
MRMKILVKEENVTEISNEKSTAKRFAERVHEMNVARSPHHDFVFNHHLRKYKITADSSFPTDLWI